MDPPASRDTAAFLAVTVPEHRVERAIREMVRRGLGPFCLALGAYYGFLSLFHVVFGASGVWLMLAGSCALSGAAFLGAGLWMRTRLIPLAHAWAWVVLVAAVVLANVSMFQVLGDEPRNVVNYALINVVAGMVVLSRPVLIAILAVDAAAWFAAMRLSGLEDPAFDGAFLAGTWVLALGLSAVQRHWLENREALRLGAEMALDKAERRLEQRDRAILAHQRSQEGLRRLIEATQEGVLILQGGEVVYANRAFRARMGLRKGAVIGHRLDQLVHGEDADYADTSFLAQEAADGVEVRFVDGDGAPVSLEVTAAAMEYGDGPAVLLICHDPAALDGPDRQALANRMLAVGTLAAGVAHEINNPLAYTIANLELLHMELGDEEGTQRFTEALKVALEGAHRVKDIVADLRTFSREDEESVLAVDVQDLLETSIRMAWNEIRHRANLVREYSDPPAVMANPSRLGQVFLNLLVNAAQAIGDGDATGDEIRVRTLLDERGVVVEVSDTGQGMSELVQEQIFRPFFTTKPVGVGTGLGLPFCRDAVESMSGRIEVESELGAGSVFRVVLPAGALQATPLPPSLPPRPASGPPRKVLVVDDEAPLAQAIATVLKSDDVVVVSSGREGLVHLESGDWDVILCDVMMPEMSGPDFYVQAVARRPELADRFAFITGGTFTEATRAFLEQTTSPILVKPFRARAIRALVDQLVSA